jgi:phosphoribosylamine--glycine ligase
LKVLVVGGGGREHALVWKLYQSPLVGQIIAAPGNPGIARYAECVPVGAGDIPGLIALARARGVDLTFVGPEAPLVNGLVDAFEREGLRVFGPGRQAAALEGSKAFAKDLMARHGIPTADYRVFEDVSAARAWIKNLGRPCVVKADGLAAGKGVMVAETTAEALAAVDKIMVEKSFGGAGSRVVIEERLSGEEVSILAFTDGKTVLPLLPAQDHKPVFDDDRGPNTGGMGAYAPAPVCTPTIYQRAVREILEPVVMALREEGIIYKGVLYAGLMVTSDGPKVLEFNVRFGDPEAQPLLVLLETDLVEVAQAVLEGRLADLTLSWREGAAVCVVLASKGYPGAYEMGAVIHGLDEAEKTGALVFHAGTARRDGQLVTAGGRVLGVTAVAATLPEAIREAYRAAELVDFAGKHFRRDIGRKALKA